MTRTKIERVGGHLLIGDEAIPIATIRASSCTKADVQCYVWSDNDPMDGSPIVAHGWTAREVLEVAYGGGEWLCHPKPTDETRALVDEIESQRETIRSLHTALDDLTRAGLEMEQAKNEEIAVLRADLARARRNAAHFEQLFENVEKARAWFSRELDAARTAVGEAWFTGGVTLAEAIERKCRALESDAAKAAAEVKRLQGPSEEPKSEIKRYDTTTVYIGCGEYVGDVEETEDGDYVLFDDHRAIVERLRARVAELERDARLGAAVREAVERVEDDHVAGHLVVVSATERSAYDEDDIVITEDKLDVLRAIDRVLAEEEEADDAS